MWRSTLFDESLESIVKILKLWILALGLKTVLVADYNK